LQISPLGLLLLTACVTFALAGFLLTAVAWMIVCAAIITMLVYAHERFAWELSRSRLLVEHEILDKMAFAQEPVAVKFRITNLDDVPLHATLEDLLPEDSLLGAGNNRTDANIPAKSVSSFTYSFIPTRRGAHAVGNLLVHRTDAFGLYTHTQSFEDGRSLDVHTHKESFDVARKIAGREHFEYAGMSRTPAVVLREFEFDGLREHVPGDKTRDIYWKGLPKTGKLMTKMYKKEGTLRTMIFVDCSRSMRLVRGGMAKVDHAVDLGLQLSNVLLSSFHPAGVATYDEVTVTGQVPPALGKHQFERITKALRGIPGAVIEAEPETPTQPVTERESVLPTANNGGEGAAFLEAVRTVKLTEGKRGAVLGLEGVARSIISRSKGQELLFIIVSDLVSSRDSVLSTARLCQRTGNRLLVIQTYEDWYASPDKVLDMTEGERLYMRLSEGVKLEAALRRAGATFLRIGPADTTARIVRSVRRGMA
jgi:uncharacterized protein (DUF58 family)